MVSAENVSTGYINDGSTMDQREINYGSTMDKRWINDVSTMYQQWINDGSTRASALEDGEGSSSKGMSVYEFGCVCVYGSMAVSVTLIRE